jgi:UDP-3-O-[3-hydroxymyristoyl] glucosamine N-acyltransferase
MADPRFFTNAGPFPLSRLAEIGEAELAAGVDPDRAIADVAPLDRAGADDVSFLDNRKYVGQFEASGAGACVVDPAFADRAPPGMALLLSPKPYRSYALIAQAFYPRPSAVPGIHAAAVVDPTAVVDDTAEIGPGAVIGAHAAVGPRTRIAANAVVDAGVEIGMDGTIGANASLSHCRIGDRVTIYPGVRIGQDGFGFAMDASGHVKVPQLGRVIVEDDVEIGANTTIDRGAGPDTVIGRGAMIDNLVQIGHNVTVGSGAVIVAQAGVAGSAKIGRFAALGAQSGVVGHITVGDGGRLAAKSGAMRDIEPGAEHGGLPAMPIRQYFRMQTQLLKLLKNKGG